MIEAVGGFVEIHVATPIETCEIARPQRPVRQGAGRADSGVHRGVRLVRNPENPELSIDTTDQDIDAVVQQILLKLEHEGYLR